MNGPDHYRRAEQLIAEARKAIAPPPGFTPVTPGAPARSELHQRAITEAQVHAPLALPLPSGGCASGTMSLRSRSGRLVPRRRTGRCRLRAISAAHLRARGI